MIFKLIILLAVAVVSVYSVPIDKARLRFKVSARSLPDKDNIGTIDPYVEIFYTENGGTNEIKLGRSDTITDNENPDWGNIFEFDFDRAKSQRWRLKIYDHDNAREDDGGGKAWVDVTDYVDRGQLVNAKLDKKNGYITIKSVDVQPDPAPGVPRGQLPVPYGVQAPDTGVLKFKLAASNLPDKDNLGTIDPYVELHYTDGIGGKQHKFGRSGTLTNTKNPSWGEVFEFNFDRKKEQFWYFKIYDHDNLREDDGAGKVWINVNDYVAKGQLITVNLSKRGTLTVTRADGGPVGIQYTTQPPPTYAQTAQGIKSPNQPPYPNQPQQYPNQPQQYPNQPQPYPNQPGFINPQYPNQPAPGVNPQYPNQPYPNQPGVNQPYPNQPGVVNPPYPNQPGVNQPYPYQPSAPVAPYPNQPVNTPYPPNYTPAPVSVKGPTPSTPVLVKEQPTKLKFRLSARGLDDKDLIGTSDPYVKVYATESGGGETLVGTTAKLNDNENPEWPDTFEFNYDKSKNQKWRFLVLDEDDNRRDDELGEVTIDVSEFASRNDPLTVSLKKGTLTIRKA